MTTATIVYASGSKFKQEEAAAIQEHVRFPSSGSSWATQIVGQHVAFEFRKGTGREILEMDLGEMVRHKAKTAYRQLQVPCIVEHGGLIFADRYDAGYPGGLTQPMWDALNAEGFIAETRSAGREAIARSVVGYCDGTDVVTFTGETKGFIATSPRGTRSYYWDTIFQPLDESGQKQPLTYAEIVDYGPSGLVRKVLLSQSTKAIVDFAYYRLMRGESPLFRNLG